MKSRLAALLLTVAVFAVACQATATVDERADGRDSPTPPDVSTESAPLDPSVPLPEPTPGTAMGPIDIDPADLPSLNGTIRPLPAAIEALVPTRFDQQAELAASAKGETVRLHIVLTRSDQPDDPAVITGEANTATSYQRIWTPIDPYVRHVDFLQQQSAESDTAPGTVEQLHLGTEVVVSRGLHSRLRPRFEDTQPDRWYETRSIVGFELWRVAELQVGDVWERADDVEPLHQSERQAGGWDATSDVRSGTLDLGSPLAIATFVPFNVDDTRVTIEADAEGKIARYELAYVEDDVTYTLDVRLFDRGADLEVPSISEVFQVPTSYLDDTISRDHGWHATGEYRSSANEPLVGPFRFSGSHNYNSGIELLSMPAADYAEMFGLDPIDSDVPIERQGTDRRTMQSRGLLPEIMPWWAMSNVNPDLQYGYDPFGERMPSILRLGRLDMALWRFLKVEPQGQPNPAEWPVYRTTVAELDPAALRYLADSHNDSFFAWVEVADDVTGATLTVGADDTGVITRLRVQVDEADGGGGIWDFEIGDVFEPAWPRVAFGDHARVKIGPQWQEFLDDASHANENGDYDSFYDFALEQRSVVDPDDVPEHVTVIATYAGSSGPENSSWYRWPGSVGLWPHQLDYGFGSSRNDIICIDLGPEIYQSRSPLQRLWNDLPEGQSLTGFEVNGGNNLTYIMDFYAFDGPRPDTDPCVWFPQGNLPGFG